PGRVGVIAVKTTNPAGHAPHSKGPKGLDLTIEKRDHRQGIRGDVKPLGREGPHVPQPPDTRLTGVPRWPKLFETPVFDCLALLCKARNHHAKLAELRGPSLELPRGMGDGKHQLSLFQAG